jgi:hypothetical protein
VREEGRGNLATYSTHSIIAAPSPTAAAGRKCIKKKRRKSNSGTSEGFQMKQGKYDTLASAKFDNLTLEFHLKLLKDKLPIDY